MLGKTLIQRSLALVALLALIPACTLTGSKDLRVPCDACSQVAAGKECAKSSENCTKGSKDCAQCPYADKGAEACAAKAECAVAAGELCPDCGEVQGSDECCDAAAARCQECGKIKGSPGCCK